ANRDPRDARRLQVCFQKTRSSALRRANSPAGVPPPLARGYTTDKHLPLFPRSAQFLPSGIPPGTARWADQFAPGRQARIGNIVALVRLHSYAMQSARAAAGPKLTCRAWAKL